VAAHVLAILVGLEPGGADAVGGLLTQLGGLLQPALNKAMGGSAPVTAETAELVARSLFENPDFIAAVRGATQEPSVQTTVVTPIAPAQGKKPAAAPPK